MNDILKCSHCQSLLIRPVLLPCGHLICQEHTEKLNHVNCQACNVRHKVLAAANSFAPVQAVEKIIERELESVKQIDEYRKAMESCVDFERLVGELRRIELDPIYEINRVIDQMKNQIDLRREELKVRAD